MRLTAVIPLAAVPILLGCAHRAREAEVALALPPTVAPTNDLFARTVAPILAQHCMPCHYPNGKMYERLPFDDPPTIAGHREGVLRRIKLPEERQAVEAWLATLDAGR